MATFPELLVDARSIPVRNAWSLLLYAWDMARWQGTWASTAESATTLRGLLASVLIACTKQLIRRQLGRAFSQSSGEIRGIRGRIDFSGSMRKLSFESGQAICVYPELSIDTPRNRILRSTLARLSLDQTIGLGANTDSVRVLRHELRTAIRDLDGIKQLAIQASDFSRLHLGRNDAEYRLPLAICELLHRNENPSEEAGDKLVNKLLRDEIPFARLFEKFVRNFYRFHRPDARVESQHLSWFNESNCVLVPRMKTDITIEWGQPVQRRLVIDTKYYASTLARRDANQEKFHSANLYQLYTYLRTQEHRGAAFRSGSGLLLYPTTHVSLDERMRVQGHEMRVKTIDLALPWAELERELLAIVG